MDVINYERFDYHIIDRAFVDSLSLYCITQTAAYFVVGADSNLKFKRMYFKRIDKSTGIIYD